MGSRFPPLLAIIFMDHLERPALFLCDGRQPRGQAVRAPHMPRVPTAPSLRRLLTASRPYENLCDRMNCIICEGENQICQMRGVVYKVVCLSCDEFYIGETAGPLRKRIEEHLRALRSPQSYPDNPFSKHRTFRHTQDPQPQLRVSILHKNVSDTVERKIKEALEIQRWRPPINKREEMKMAMSLITL
ncbi:unnamed protein product [Heligmosomoides polygyrus]|uniref:GIY-YIG domain-containing protein n=1 Tax=Heligmosomoides polygyrus TaxID=6339 RepID=A0A183GM07_HELPZ|nr:unnamed protein product [Heligmosomoides polygyrus]